MLHAFWSVLGLRDRCSLNRVTYIKSNGMTVFPTPKFLKVTNSFQNSTCNVKQDISDFWFQKGGSLQVVSCGKKLSYQAQNRWVTSFLVYKHIHKCKKNLCRIVETSLHLKPSASLEIATAATSTRH